MQTTLRIKDDLYRAAKARAALEGVIRLPENSLKNFLPRGHRNKYGFRAERNLFAKINEVIKRNPYNNPKFIEDALDAKLHQDINQLRRPVELPTFDGGRFLYSPQELKRLIEDTDSCVCQLMILPNRTRAPELRQ